MFGKIFFLAVVFGSAVGVSASVKDGTLTVERLFQDPNIEGPTARVSKFFPDEKYVIYLKEKKADFKKLDLWGFDLNTMKSRLLVNSADLERRGGSLSPEEKAIRERKRISDSGIVEYSLPKSGGGLVFSLGGKIYFVDPSLKQAPKELTSSGKGELDVQLSPQGHFASFVRDGNIFFADVKSGLESRLTFDGKGLIKNGLAEFIAQEEMDRFSGYWWSPDEKFMAFTQTDETPVGVMRRFEIKGDGFEVFDQRYPRAGTRNVDIRVGVVATIPGQSQKSVKWLDLKDYHDFYLARVDWLNDSKRLAVQIENRDQKQLDMLIFDVTTGESKRIIRETDKFWVDLHNDLHFLKKSNRFIWSSERSGFRHIYLYQIDGTLVRQLTHGSWPVRSVEGVDEEQGRVYFTASVLTPLEQHLNTVPLDGGDVRQITKAAGWHNVSLSPHCKYFTDTYSNTNQPPQGAIKNIDDTTIGFLEENRVDGNHPLKSYAEKFSQPEYGTIPARDGTTLYYSLIKPRNFDPHVKYPVIVQVYGGPTVQVVTKAWGRRNYLWSQILAEKGYLVFSLDNRGSAHRGKKFSSSLFHQLGKVEVDDQKTGVDFLIAKGFVDPARVGIFGWSYGGFMVLMSMLKEPGTFKVGVAVAPVTDLSLYDTYYTEKYLGDPNRNKDGYAKSNVLTYAGNLSGRLLMIHGMSDDNVLFTNSTMLYKAFQEKGLLFDIMTYPGAKHGISGKALQTHVFKTIARYFDEHLLKN